MSKDAREGPEKEPNRLTLVGEGVAMAESGLSLSDTSLIGTQTISICMLVSCSSTPKLT